MKISSEEHLKRIERNTAMIIKHREYLLSGDEQKAQLAADINRELEAANRKRWAAVLGAEHAN
jgi:hypothetical protein